MKTLLCFLLIFTVLRVCESATELFLTNFAGNGSTGYSGENIPATAAQMATQGVWYVVHFLCHQI
jgi:hypothetical protein